MMKLSDVLAWLKANPNKFMVQGGITAKVFKTPVRKAGSSSGGGTLFKVTIEDAVGASSGPSAGSSLPTGISTRVIHSGGRGSSSTIDTSGLTPQQITQKLGSLQQKNIRDERINADEEQRRFENDQREKERQNKLDRYNERYPTKFGKYVIGGKVVGVTSGSEDALAKLVKVLPESKLVTDSAGNYQLLNYTQREGLQGGLANEFEFKKFNEKIKEQGGQEYIGIGKTALGGNALKIGLADSVGINEPVPEYIPTDTKNPIIPPEQIKSTKYFANVGSEQVRSEYTLKDEFIGKNYQVELFDSLGNRLETDQKDIINSRGEIINPSEEERRYLSEFYNQYKSTNVPSKTILEGYLKDRNVKITPEGKKYIEYLTENEGFSSDKFAYQNLGSTYEDKKRNQIFNTKTGVGDFILGYRITGQKPRGNAQNKIPDPLGIISGLKYLTDASEKKSLESFEILKSNADFRTKGKAAIEQTEAEIGKTLFGAASSFINLGGAIRTYQTGKENQPLIEVKYKTGEDIFIEKSFAEKDIPTGILNIPKNAYSSGKEYVQKYGLAGLIGTGIGTAVSLYTLKGASPLKLGSKFVIPLGSGATKTVRTLTTYRGKELIANVGRSFSTSGEKAVLKSGVLKDFDFPKLVRTYTEKSERGVENEFLGRTGARILSSDKVLTELENIGKLKAGGAKTIQASKEIVQESKRVPNKLFRDNYSAQPFENIPKELTKTQLDYFRGSKITLEGSAIDIPTFLREFAGKSGDFDVKVQNFAKAVKNASINTKVLNEGIDPNFIYRIADKSYRGRNIVYVAERGKINLYERIGTGTKPVYPKLKLGSDEALHATSKKSVRNISNYGVDISASKRGNAFFITNNIKLGKHFAKRASITQGSREAFLKIKFNKSQVLKFNKLPKDIKEQILKNPNQFKRNQRILISYAKSKGKYAVEKPYKAKNPSIRNEIIIFDERAIKSVKEIPIGREPVPILGKKIGKAGEYLSHDDPESLGQISKSGSVFEVKTPQKTIKVEDIKQKTLNFQLHRRSASVSSFKIGKNGIVEVGPPEHRVKDYPRLYAGAKTSAFLHYIEKGKLPKALRIEQAANIIKQQGEKEINFKEFFESRRLTEAYVQSPSRTKQASNYLLQNLGSDYTKTGVYGGSFSSKYRNNQYKGKSPNYKIESSRPSKSVSSYYNEKSLNSYYNPKSISSYYSPKSVSSYYSPSKSPSYSPSKSPSYSPSKSAYGSSISKSPYSPSKSPLYSPYRSPSKSPYRSPYSPYSRSYSPSRSPAYSSPYSPPYVPPYVPKIVPKIVPSIKSVPLVEFKEGKTKLFHREKNLNYFRVFDVSRTPFGKIKYTVGYQQQSYKPIQEIKGRAKYPIGQIQPANIFNLKINNVYKTKGLSKRNKYGYVNPDIF